MSSAAASKRSNRTAKYQQECHVSEPYQFFTDVSVISIQYFANSAFSGIPSFKLTQMNKFMDGPSSMPGFVIKRKTISVDDETGAMKISKQGHCFWMPLRVARHYFTEKNLQNIMEDKVEFDELCEDQPMKSHTWYVKVVDDDDELVSYRKQVGGRNGRINECTYATTLSSFFLVMNRLSKLGEENDDDEEESPLCGEKECHSMTNKVISQMAVYVNEQKPYSNCPFTYDEIVALLESEEVRDFVQRQVAENTYVKSGSGLKRKAIDDWGLDDVEGAKAKKTEQNKAKLKRRAADDDSVLDDVEAAKVRMVGE
jgi:hypothetical protein